MSLKAAHFLVAGAVLAAGCCVSSAQEVIHALIGVATIDGSTHTITMTSSDGTQTVVKDEAKNHPRYDFDKTLQASAVDSSTFAKSGDRVILYYFGEGLQRRAVAVKDLGQSPLKLTTGQIEHWDHHHHVMTIKAADGTRQTFQLDGGTAVDTPMGVVNGDKFTPQTGDQILIKYLNKDGNNDAVFASES